MNRTHHAMTAVAGTIATLALAATLSTGPASAATTPSVPSAEVAASTPYHYYSTFPSEIECGQTGHNLVDRGPYASYMCTRVLSGWELWVR